MIRPTAPDDLPALKEVIAVTDLFPAEMLDEMIGDSFAGGECSELWWTLVFKEQPVGVAYVAPERMTEGTWNCYLLAIHPKNQGQGNGSAMMKHVEQYLASAGARVLLVETSSLAEYAPVREFYRKNGYTEEACIRDFYTTGDDKIVFWKLLSGDEERT